MKYILDTHIVLWLAENSHKLSDNAKNIILDTANEKYVSVASCWETSIKLSLGKLELEGGTSGFYNIVDSNGFVLIPVEERHLSVVESLPFHHRDPFDRLLAATAISEGLTLLTDDTQLLAYKQCGLMLAS